MPIVQKFNKRIKAWVMMKKMPNGKLVIMNVKQRLPMKPFIGIPKIK